MLHKELFIWVSQRAGASEEDWRAEEKLLSLPQTQIWPQFGGFLESQTLITLNWNP